MRPAATTPVLSWAGIRILLFGALIAAGFLVLWIKLYIEQIETAETYMGRVVRQSVRRIRIPARRGKIYSSDRKLLAGNSAECNLLFYPEEMREAGRRSRTVSYIYRAAEVIARAIGRSNPLTETAIERHLNTRPGLPLTVFRNLTPQELARALESSRKLRGVDFIADESRTYPEGRLAAHLIGSTRLESPQQASDRKEFFYYVPDPIGREGLERAFDRIPDGGEDPAAPLGLRGRPGYSLVQVDHLGFIRQSLIEKIEPRHGNNLILTLDSRAQQIAESLIDGERAALVLLDASNGDVLAAASSPGYDLGRFTPVLTPGYYRSLLDNPDRPLINRALFEIYPPGSILKPLVALAFLNSGVDPAEKTNCDGGTPIGNASIRCASWRYGGHGPLDMVGALAHSCNDYMVEHALKIGFEPIAAMLDSAGIGRKTGIELPESRGIAPSDRYKRRVYGYGWNRFDTGLLSIGQGIISITPLQAAVFTAALANGGTVWRPHLGLRVVDAYGNPLYERVPEATGHLESTPEALETVRRGMFEVVNTPTGSGREAAVPGLEIYGKTGSAEIGTGVRGNLRLITWFIAFTSWKGRTYALALMVEGGRSGGRTCAPLAAEFFRRYLLGNSNSSSENHLNSSSSGVSLYTGELLTMSQVKRKPGKFRP